MVLGAMCARTDMTMHEMRNENIILLFGLLAGRKQVSARIRRKSNLLLFTLFFFRFENSPISEDKILPFDQIN